MIVQTKIHEEWWVEINTRYALDEAHIFPTLEGAEQFASLIGRTSVNIRRVCRYRNDAGGGK